MIEKMKKLFFVLLAVVAMNLHSFAGNYKENVQEIDALIASSEDVSINEIYSLPTASSAMNTNATISSADPWVAFAICTVIGGLGIHRHYLGTKPAMWAIYLFTCGGIFGVVPTVDWIVLLIGAINEDIGKFVGNQQFFMWAN